MERAGAVVRRELNAAGLTKEKLGVIFASGDFHAKFATHLDRASGDFVRRIDAHYERGLAIRSGSVFDPTFDIQNFDQWIAGINAVEVWFISQEECSGGVWVLLYLLKKKSADDV